MFRFLLPALLALAPLAAQAETVLGLWATEPDRDGEISHIQARPCGATFCGVVVGIVDLKGVPVNSPHVGKRVFWNLRPVGSGRYEGRAFIPTHGRSYRGRMEVSGDRAKVWGCLGPICMSQVWRRLD